MRVRVSSSKKMNRSYMSCRGGKIIPQNNMQLVRCNNAISGDIIKLHSWC
jgi:hypothetical protein